MRLVQRQRADPRAGVRFAAFFFGFSLGLPALRRRRALAIARPEPTARALCRKATVESRGVRVVRETMRRLPVFLALACLAVASVAARADIPPTRTVDYTIRRNGDAIGTHHVEFQRQGERFTVHHRIDIRVSVLAMEAYRYTMDSRETWQGERLLGLTASTDRNGDALTVFARAGGEQLRIRGPEGRRQVPATAVPSSPQHFVFDQPRPVMIEAEDGRVLRVRTQGPTTENLRLGGRSVPCRRVRVSGDLEATLWYGPSGILVKKQLTAPDGSTVLTVLR